MMFSGNRVTKVLPGNHETMVLPGNHETMVLPGNHVTINNVHPAPYLLYDLIRQIYKHETTTHCD